MKLRSENINVKHYIGYNFDQKNFPTNGQVLKRILALKHDKVIKPFRLISTEIEKIGIMSGLNSVLVDRIERMQKGESILADFVQILQRLPEYHI
ncbi:hypothetical protein A3Q56_05495 [Intoshia linei]|uniref:Uncharacterized protein n=1 Tax=Intoshia linei TaxID=1819745 RepID=A0A177AY35_9BILA|nr:hypothetical protein A3Q56_05495 [Intoshia linei]